MQLEPVFPEALRQYVRDAPCNVLILKADDEIVGKSYQETMPAHPWLDFGLNPDIQHMVEIDVRQQGADDPLHTDDPDRNFMHAGLAVSAQFGEGRAAFILYEGLFAHDYFSSATLQAGLRLEF
jgi:hypothetical protein